MDHGHYIRVPHEASRTQTSPGKNRLTLDSDGYPKPGESFPSPRLSSHDALMALLAGDRVVDWMEAKKKVEKRFYFISGASSVAILVAVSHFF